MYIWPILVLSRHNQIKEALSHPMLLLIVGAIITSLIIPDITRQWQDYQHQLELKSDLSDQINKAISTGLAAAKANNSPYGHDPNVHQKYLDTYLDLDTAKDIIESKIKIYFYDNQLAKNWDNLVTLTKDFLDVSGGLNYSHRYNYDYYKYLVCFRLGVMLQTHALLPISSTLNINRSVFDSYQCNNYYFPGSEYRQQIPTYSHNNSDIDWHALLVFDNRGDAFYRSFAILRDDITNYKSSLLTTIFNSSIRS